jgi:hypothetical protein
MTIKIRQYGDKEISYGHADSEGGINPIRYSLFTIRFFTDKA